VVRGPVPTPLPSPPGVWVYRAGALTVAGNFSDGTTGPLDLGGPVLLATGEQVHSSPGGVCLGPWEAAIVRHEEPGRRYNHQEHNKDP
jgi:hypothetical protein